MPDSVRTRLLLLSDTHARTPSSGTSGPHASRWPFPQADVAIHTGDLTTTGTIAQHEQAINLLKQLQADLKIVIPGNHDLTLDRDYYAEHGHLYGPTPKYTEIQLQNIRDLYTGSAARAANIVYLEEGTRTFQLKNGASLTIYASAYTPEYNNWAFAYPRKLDRFNDSSTENQVPNYRADASTNIDVMLTHGPPVGILDKVDGRHGDGDLHVGCEHLYRAVERSRPLLHCFGHIHEGWGGMMKKWTDSPRSMGRPSTSEIETGSTSVPVDMSRVSWDMAVVKDATDIKRGCETLFVNSSIMDVNYSPNQFPWLVDVMLPKRT